MVEGRRRPLRPQHRDGRSAHLVVHHAALLQQCVGIGDRLVIQLDGQHPRHRRKVGRRGGTAVQERAAPFAVVASVGIHAVLAPMTRVPGHDVAVGKGGLEILPAHHGKRDEAQPAAGVGAGDPLARGLLPPRFGLPVVHDQVAVIQPPGRAEIQHLVVEAAVEGDRGVAERTERDRHRQVAELVVDDLVPSEDLDGIRAHPPAGLDHGDRLKGLQPGIRVGDRQVLRVVDRGDAVLGRTAGEDLRVGHRVAAEVGPELPGCARRRRLLGKQLDAAGIGRHRGGLRPRAGDRDPGDGQDRNGDDGERDTRVGGLKLHHRRLDRAESAVLTERRARRSSRAGIHTRGNSFHRSLPTMNIGGAKHVAELTTEHAGSRG